MPKPVKDKYAIAAVLQEIGTLLELKGGEYFKARAYKLGARSVAELSEDLGTLIKQNRLTSVKGIGYGLARQIEELYTAGESSFLNELRARVPPGVVELAGVRGLNLKKIQMLHDVLGIASVSELEAAAEAGKLKDVNGFGAKSEQRILEALAGSQDRRDQPIHIHHALRGGEGILEYLETSRDFIKGEFGGDLRRWQETVSEIVVVAASKKPKALIDHFLRFPMVTRTEGRLADRATVVLSEGSKATLIVVPPKEFPVVLFKASASAAHLQRVDEIALQKKLKIAGNKLQKTIASKSRSIEVKSEAEIYQRLGMQYVPPELREDAGEIEAALRGKIPADLVTTEDIRGMVHCHTTYSDGKHSVEQMVAAAEALGMKYITITDHSPTAFYAGGVKINRMQR